MYQKTFTRFAVTVIFTFSMAIMLMAFDRRQSACAETAKPAQSKPATNYGEYIILESISSTALSIQ